MINCALKDLPKLLNKQMADVQKAVRLATYKALEKTAEDARDAIIAQYAKQFPDENGIKKNKGVPQQVTHSKVDKAKMRIEIFAKDKINFMDDQEFGGERRGASGGSRAVPTLETRQQGRTTRGNMKQAWSIKNLMTAAMRAETEKSRKAGKPKPFIMTSQSGHHMLVRRENKARDSIKVLYHFDKKVQIRPRWDFIKTVEGVTAHNMEKNFNNELEAALKKYDKNFK